MLNSVRSILYDKNANEVDKAGRLHEIDTDFYYQIRHTAIADMRWTLGKQVHVMHLLDECLVKGAARC